MFFLSMCYLRNSQIIYKLFMIVYSNKHLFIFKVYFLIEGLSAALNMTANMENSAVAAGLEKVSFHSNPKERQCQRMLKLPHNCTHLTC